MASVWCAVLSQCVDARLLIITCITVRGYPVITHLSLYCRWFNVSHNQLRGTVPPSLATATQPVDTDLSNNLLTGNATLFVEKFTAQPFQYNCFNPEVPPANPSC
jgi:hypothetical protein